MSRGIDPRILSQLVAYDRQVHDCRHAIASARRKLAALEALEAEHLSMQEDAKTRSTGIKLEIRKGELEVEDLRRQVKTHNHRLNEISDTREYRALGDEVRYLQRQIEGKEEELLKLMEELEKQGKEVDSTTSELQTQRAEIQAKRAKIEAETERQDQDLARASEHLDAFLKQVPEATLSFYRRKSARQEMPVVWEREGACSYCHHKLTPQAAIEVRQGRNLVVCESCGRVVVAPDEKLTRPANELK